MSKLFNEYFKREGAGTSGEYIIFNIIADDGSETIELYNYFPNAKIYAFEGDATMSPICSANLAPYADRITFTPIATTNYDGSMILHSNEVPCGRIDTFIQANSIPRVDFLLINHKFGIMSILEGLGDYLQSVQYLYSLITYYEVFTGQVIDCNEYLQLNHFRTMDPLSMQDWADNAMYCNNRFDVVSCLGDHSTDHIAQFVQSTLANVERIHYLYLVVPDTRVAEVAAMVAAEPKCVVISESVFPFSIQMVNSYNPDSPNSLNTGLFYQLIKLHAWKIIPGITNRHLVIDANVFFVSTTAFTDKSVNLYSFTSGLDQPVFDHIQSLHPFFRRVDADKSGECGHMMFEARLLDNVFGLAEFKHKQSFHIAYLNCGVPSVTKKTTSDYELLFNYLQLSGYTNHTFRELSSTTTTSLADVDTTTDVNYVVVI